jgi:hypothetical protein
MKRLFYLILAFSLFFGCSERNTNSSKTENIEIDSFKIDFFQSDTSSFKILKRDSFNGKLLNPKYIVTETKYQVFRILDSNSTNYNMTYHIAKIKTLSEMINGSEDGITKISAEIRNFDNPEKIEFIIEETESDEIKFEPNFYRIIEYGCCEFDGWIRLFNYQQKLVDEGKPEMIYEKYPEW